MFNKCYTSAYLLYFIGYELYERAKQFTETRNKGITSIYIKYQK